MPESAGEEMCLEALPSLQPFESAGAPFEFHASPAASGSAITSTYYPSAFLQAGAVLAVHLAARTRVGQGIEHDQDGNGPDQIADPATAAAAGAGPGAGPGTLDFTVDLSLTGTGNNNTAPCMSGCPARSLDNFSLIGNLTDSRMQTLMDAATMSDTDPFDHAHNSPTSSPPPRKRRRFEGKASGHQQQHQNVITDITRGAAEMDRLSSPPELSSTIKLNPLLDKPKEPEATETKLEGTWSETEIPASLPTRRPVGLVPERTPFSFFHFPGEIRNPIYSYSLHWPTTQELYRAYYSQLDEHYRYEDLHPYEPKRRPPTYKPKFRTPTILLLCRRITMECLGILQSRTLVIDGMPPWQTGDLRPLPITSFIPKTTFQAIRRLEIRIPMGLGSYGSGWVWSDIACDLFDMLRERNSFEHLRVVFVIRYSPGNGAWRTSEQQHLELIDHSLVKLERENPNLKWPCKLEREYWIVEGRRASKAHTNSKGELHPSNEELRTYPDDKIWPGCLLDFV